MVWHPKELLQINTFKNCLLIFEVDLQVSTITLTVEQLHYLGLLQMFDLYCRTFYIFSIY